MPETSTEWERFTALVNTPVQGGSAHDMKQALPLIASRMPTEARLISTVHAEVLVEAPEAMATLFPQVPIEVEAGSCSHGGDKK